jgi:hypothetical protein
MMDNICDQKLASILMVFNIPFEHLRIHVRERATNDGFYDVLDARIYGSDLPCKPAKAYGVQALEASNLQNMLVGQIKPLIHSSILLSGIIRGLTALAHPSRITEPPAAIVDRKTFPIQQVIEFG